MYWLSVVDRLVVSLLLLPRDITRKKRSFSFVKMKSSFREKTMLVSRQRMRAIAMKGSTAQEEANDCKHALKILGGKLDRIDTIQLPAMEYPHHLVVVEKVHRTPKIYPRNPGTPTREPL